MTLEQWISEQIEWAEAKAAESWSTAPNSYGAGYDRGYADAMITAKNDAPVPNGEC